jgi:hypothetical protein
MRSVVLAAIWATASGRRYSYTWGADGECRSAGLGLGIQATQLHCARAAGVARCDSFMYAPSLQSCSCCEVLDPPRNSSALQLLYHTYEVLDCDEIFAEGPAEVQASGPLSSAVLMAYGRLWFRAKEYLHC